ncbi:hypothetical protein [Adlercreutzia sp. ZJ138]|uniref:hypothetical protein n=1 Tax=Adlercreutzia sp. ZJ138 TaxID=2709405 RepID=UPI0013EA9ED1|nr:hypothetical protein [Adlercreutzia sp. ZJ138]
MRNKPLAILLAGTLAGTLVGAIGVGVAFAEYMSFDVDTTSIPAEGERMTKEETFELNEDETVLIANDDAGVVFDDTIAPGTVSVSVEYNSAATSPIISTDKYPQEQTVLVSVTILHIYDSLDQMITNKDIILDNLKRHVLVVPQVDDGTTITVKANPTDKDRVKYYNEIESYTSNSYDSSYGYSSGSYTNSPNSSSTESPDNPESPDSPDSYNNLERSTD